MNTNEIEVLLGKYYEGQTSLHEEKLLRDFFSGQDIPGHLKSHQPLFTFFNGEQKQELPSRDFEQKLTARLKAENQDGLVKPISGKRNRLAYVAGIAATILLIVSLFATFRHDIIKNGHIRETSGNTELAYQQANEALLIVSGNLNTGLKQMGRLQMVDKALQNLQLFHKFYQYQTIIINPDELQNPSIKSK